MSRGKMMGKAMHWGRWWIDKGAPAGAGRAAETRHWLDTAQGEILDAQADEDALVGLHDYHEAEGDATRDDYQAVKDELEACGYHPALAHRLASGEGPGW